jgi:hypothetical protein
MQEIHWEMLKVHVKESDNEEFEKLMNSEGDKTP